MRDVNNTLYCYFYAQKLNLKQKSGIIISHQSTEDVSAIIDPDINSSRNDPETVAQPDTMVDKAYPKECRDGKPSAGKTSTEVKWSEKRGSKQRGQVKSRARKRMLTAQKARVNGMRNIWISEQRSNKNWRRSNTGMFRVF